MRVVDLHCDTLYKHVINQIPLDDPENEVQVDYSPNHHKLQCYAIWLPDSFSDSQAEAIVFKAAKCLESECGRLNIHLIKHCEQIRDEVEKNSNTAFFTIENGKALNGKLENIREFSKLGVKMMTLTWNAHNCIGDGADVTNPQGLTCFGKQAISEMENVGIIIDISHASEKLFWEVAENTKRPFVASHSNAFSITSHRRNLSDSQIEEIIKRKGLFGLNFHNAFLNINPDNASLTDILRHTDHFLSLGGEDSLCFGSDFDGGILPNDIKNSRIYNNIYECFSRHHYSDRTMKKIFYDNALNFFENFDNYGSL